MSFREGSSRRGIQKKRGGEKNRKSKKPLGRRSRLYFCATAEEGSKKFGMNGNENCRHRAKRTVRHCDSGPGGEGAGGQRTGIQLGMRKGATGVKDRSAKRWLKTELQPRDGKRSG